MGNYVKTGPFVVGSAPGINAPFLNAMENVFVQPSGGSETGKYRLTFNGSAAGYFGSLYMPTLSRGATPVSMSIDATDDAATNMSSGPTYGNLTANGFQITGQANGNAGNCHCGGNWTVNY